MNRPGLYESIDDAREGNFASPTGKKKLSKLKPKPTTKTLVIEPVSAESVEQAKIHLLELLKKLNAQA